MSLTGILDTDREILKYIENERLLKVCSINKRMWNTVCDDAFLRRRLNKFPGIEKFRKEESLKQFFVKFTCYESKMILLFDFIYSSGDFCQQYDLLSKFNRVGLLKESAKLGDLALVKYCIENKVDVNMGDSVALRCAAEYGHLEVVKYLVENGSHIFTYDDYAIRNACANGHFEIVKYLVQHGADIHGYGDSGLVMASKNGHFDIVKYLIEKGANPNAHNGKALEFATIHSHDKIVKYLHSVLR